MDSLNTLPSKKLLVAEDNESNFLLIMTILKKEYQIIHAADGLEALQKYRQYSPDAILMDLKMPNMDGLEATREIRKLNLDIPIITVSAFAFDSDKQEAKEAGCTDYFTKPIDSRLLKETLKKYLSWKQNKIHTKSNYFQQTNHKNQRIPIQNNFYIRNNLYNTKLITNLLFLLIN